MKRLRLHILLTLLSMYPAWASAQSLNFHTQLLGKFARAVPTEYSDIWGYAANGREYALVGTNQGTLIVEVTNPTEPREVAFIPGPLSIWRDIKTHSHYAYVVHDANSNQDPNPGMQIIDLSGLPNTAVLAATYRTGLGPGLAHNIYIDNGFAYLAGSRVAGGVHILDLKNPTAPVEVGTWSENYWHDVVVKNDTLYGSAMLIGAIEIVDGRDKSNLKLISRTHYPDAFTHNIWMSDDNRYLAQTDEVHGQPVNFWDVTDHLSPQLIANYSAAPNAIAHNAHIRGDFAYISYYYDGLKILDLHQRRAPVEVGYYDSFPQDNFQRGGGFDGAWGAYPFLPSGNILISDISNGLFVVRFDSTRAGYIQGKIVDSQTGEPIEGVKIELLNPDTNTGQTRVQVGADGAYIFGALPGQRRVKFSKFGYEDFVAEANLESGVTVPLNISLVARPRVNVRVTAKTTDGQPVNGAKVVFKAEDFRADLQTDANGVVETILPEANYDILFVAWGFFPQRKTMPVSQNASQVEFVTQPGYWETFTEAQTWSLRDVNDDSRFDWMIDRADSRPYGSRLPGVDHTRDAEGFVVFTRARFGRSTLTSPTFDATRFQKPVVQYARFYNPYRWASIQANDTLKTFISNDGGQTWVLMDTTTAIDPDWQVLTFHISDFVTPTQNMKLRFVNIEAPDVGNPRGSAFGMLDDIKIAGEGTVTAVEAVKTVPTTFKVLQNYPNPFNPSTTIRWQQPVEGKAEIIISNLLGQNVLTLRTGLRPAGEQIYVVDMRGRPSGIYFYRIRLGNKVSAVKKMILLK